jgi:nucleoid DNA-binding protein
MAGKSAGNKDLVEHVQKKTGWTATESRQAVKHTFEGVAKLLKANDRVTITNVGSFSKAVKPAQKGGKKAVNPFTGATYTTKAKPKSTKVKFRAGKGFKGNF